MNINGFCMSQVFAQSIQYTDQAAHVAMQNLLPHLATENKTLIRSIRWYHHIGSTQDGFIEAVPRGFQLCIADHQSKGRGRVKPTGQKKWESSTQGIYLSLQWQTTQNAPFGILIALAICQMLEPYYQKLSIKWPNDLLHHHQKFGGILIESLQDGHLQTITAGIGINLTPQHYYHLPTPHPPHLLAKLIDSVIDAIHRPQPIADRWQQYDEFDDKTIQVTTPSSPYIGKNIGINEQGYLQIATHHKTITLEPSLTWKIQKS
jgi:BirA family transcriptional regulator, biotin operon repressor / biotin---[acetyl-CoA-carboxylase] ligase